MKSSIYPSLFLLSLFISISENAFTQGWLWAKSMGGMEIEYCYGLAVDQSNGSVYTTGSFYGLADFDPGPAEYNVYAPGVEGVFISKLDASGNFVWAKAIGGTNWMTGYAIAVTTGSGDVYATGYFYGTADFDPGPGTFNLTSSFYSMFILKLDASGNFVWAKAVDGSIGHSIAVDGAGSGGVYTTGGFSGTTDFDPGAGVFNLTSAGSGEIFISKLDGAGNFVWAKSMGGTGDEAAYSITLDPTGSGYVYTTGVFNGIADFNPSAGTFNLTSSGVNDIFISKLDGAGNFVWAKSMGGPGEDSGASIILDQPGGYVYTTGSFTGTADFNPGAGTLNLTSSGGKDIFISKLDNSGNHIWAEAMGGPDNDFGSDISVDPTGIGGVYTVGSFRGIADFNPGVGTFNLTSVGEFNHDIFISKVDGSGNFEWAYGAGGEAWDWGNEIALNSSGSVHVAGDFWSPSITFGATTLNNHLFPPQCEECGEGYNSDFFVVKLNGEINLPVDLISFKASHDKKRNGVNLEWLTANEINNDHFTIERSSDLLTFKPILEVKGAGNSASILRYSSFDSSPEPGKNYYRLQQTDFDGKTTQSHIVSVNVDAQALQITLYPNPVTDKLTIEFDEAGFLSSEIRIYDILGKIVFADLDENIEQQKTIDMSGLASAIYYIEVDLDGNKVMRKVVKE